MIFTCSVCISNHFSFAMLTAIFTALRVEVDLDLEAGMDEVYHLCCVKLCAEMSG